MVVARAPSACRQRVFFFFEPECDVSCFVQPRGKCSACSYAVTLENDINIISIPILLYIYIYPFKNASLYYLYPAYPSSQRLLVY